MLAGRSRFEVQVPKHSERIRDVAGDGQRTGGMPLEEALIQHHLLFPCVVSA